MKCLYHSLVPLIAGVPLLAVDEPRRESWYRDQVATKLNGKTEVRVPDGRVDIVTDTHAIEVEFSAKWKNAIGQSLWYSLQTQKKAGIVIILKDPMKDAPDAIRLETLVKEHKLPIKVWWWPRDFAAKVETGDRMNSQSLLVPDPIK